MAYLPPFPPKPSGVRIPVCRPANSAASGGVFFSAAPPSQPETHPVPQAGAVSSPAENSGFPPNPQPSVFPEKTTAAVCCPFSPLKHPKAHRTFLQRVSPTPAGWGKAHSRASKAPPEARFLLPFPAAGGYQKTPPEGSSEIFSRPAGKSCIGAHIVPSSAFAPPLCFIVRS